MKNKFLISVLLCTSVGLGSAIACEAVPITKQQTNVLQKVTVPDSNYEVSMVMATLPPNTSKGSHAHNGPEVGYVLEGELTLLIPGQPAKTVKAGESFQYQAGVVHDTKAGPKGAKVLASWVREKEN